MVANGNRDNGVFITDVGPVIAVGGDYSDNETEGIRVLSAAEVMLDSITANGNEDDGVELDFFGDAELHNVTATHNVFDGVNIGGGFDVIVDGGVYDENGDNGISVSLSDDVVIANTSMNLVGVPALFPLSAGIYILDNTSVVLENNTITNSARVGVDVELTPVLTLITTTGNVEDSVTVDSETISHVRGVGTPDEIALDDVEYSDVATLIVDTVDSDDDVTVHLGSGMPLVGVLGGEQGYSDTLTIMRADPADAVTVTDTDITDGTTTVAYDEIEKVVVDEGDLTFDGALGSLDIDTLVEDIVAGNNTPQFELTGDNLVNHDDLVRWLELGGAANLPSGNSYLFGDANLDGSVDATDYAAWQASKFTAGALWSGGDFNADGVTDGQDLLIWNRHKFTSADSGHVADASTADEDPDRHEEKSRSSMVDLLFAQL